MVRGITSPSDHQIDRTSTRPFSGLTRQADGRSPGVEQHGREQHAYSNILDGEFVPLFVVFATAVRNDLAALAPSLIRTTPPLAATHNLCASMRRALGATFGYSIRQPNRCLLVQTDILSPLPNCRRTRL